MRQPFVAVVNLGCRVNRVESDRISCALAERGFALVDQRDADVVVVNTCAVTAEAEAKTRKAVRHALSLPREPRVVATGCVVNLHADELEQLSDRVLCEPSKVDVPDRVAEATGFSGASNGSANLELTELLGRHRIGVKVQDGCDNRCTYCIVWKARGPSRSVPVDQVVDQVDAVARAGVPEVVLTGVNLGRYDGSDEGDLHVELDELLTEILDRTDVGHVRLSSIEPQDVTDRLLAAVRDSGGRVAPFFHMPLQSGCTATLSRMGRAYTADEYLDVVERVRAVLPEAAVSCDVIVGFPGETDGEYDESRALVERVGFSRLHVFRYSRRPGTWAADAPGQVSPEVMAERARDLRELGEAMALADRRRRVGRVERCVMEDGAHGTLATFHRVEVAPDEALAGRLVSVALDGVDADGGLVGHVVDGVRS